VIVGFVPIKGTLAATMRDFRTLYGLNPMSALFLGFILGIEDFNGCNNSVFCTALGSIKNSNRFQAVCRPGLKKINDFQWHQHTCAARVLVTAARGAGLGRVHGPPRIALAHQARALLGCDRPIKG
jgi:hypothetical protein